MPRFVLLRHECPPHLAKPSHWDFMLQQDCVLATWQLIALPADWHRLLELDGSQSENIVLAERLPDHRLAYLDYEGPISGDRGEVHRIAAGTFEVLQQSDERLQVVLSSEKLQGVVQLTRDTAQPQAWQLRLS